jgi:hypothetical protein
MDQRVEARIAALENELKSLKTLVAGETEAAPPTSDRRGMIKLVAVSAVGAVTGAAMLSAQPAAAADSDNLKLGQINDATSPTILTTVGASAFVVNGDGGYGIECDGGVANALFNGTGEDPLTLALGATLGTLYVDATGDWWAATVTDPSSPAWRKLAGAQSAGQLHLLDAPVRVYDSRPGLAPETVGPKAPTTGNVVRAIDTRQNNSGVPTTANAVLINLTIAGPAGDGYASVWPSGPFPGTSNINFTAGQSIATTATVGCGPGASILVMSNTVTDFIIDVSGYYQ